MPQISRNHLPQSTWNNIWKQLLITLRSTHSEQSQHIILRGLLTNTEQTMLAKRLMVALLTQSGWDALPIAQALKMSSSTVYKVQTQYHLDTRYQQELKKMYPQKIRFSKEQNSQSILNMFLKEIIVSKAERYRRLKKL